MQATKDYLENGKIYCLGIDTPDRVWYDRTEFWYHYEKVTNSELLKYAPTTADVKFSDVLQKDGNECGREFS